MSIFIFLKFYNFKGLCINIAFLKKPKTNAFILHLLKSESSFLSFIPGHFSFISNTTNFFIHSLNRFVLKKNAYGLLVFFSRVPYMQLSHMISGVNIISRKVSVASIRDPLRAPQKFLGSKEHLNWLKLDLNAK